MASLQAVFEVKVSAPPPPIVALSNMPLSHTHEHESSDKHHDDHDDDNHHQAAADSHKKWTEEDLIAYHFKPSPPMSTYLVAWVVGELSHNEAQCELALSPAAAPTATTTSSSGGRGLKHEDHEEAESGGASGAHNVTVRVWGTSDRVQQFAHARDVACGALQEMERLTQVGYQLRGQQLWGWACVGPN